MLTESRLTRQARTPKGKLRQRVHQIRRELNLSEPAYRNVLYSLAGDRYARNLSVAQLEVVVAFLEREAANRRHPVEYVSDAEALNILGLAA
jgi:phage gp16-like protein